MDNILVLGANGFIGRHLVRALASTGHRVIAASRSESDSWPAGVEPLAGRWSEAEDFLPVVERSDFVIHAASASTPGSSASHPTIEITENLQQTASLLEALEQHRRPLLYISSGGTLYAAHDKEAATEASRVSPRSYHGAGKIAAEYFISAWNTQYSGTATILRPSNVYGPGQQERPGFGIIPTAFGKIRRGEMLHVWGDGSTTRDYLFIDDFIRLCLAIVSESSKSGTRVLNASSGVGVSLNELFSMMENVAGTVLPRSYDPGRIIDAPHIVMDSQLAEDLYQWHPQIELAAGLEFTWNWLITSQR